MTDILEQLDHDLVGLKPVKKRVREIAALLVVDKMRRKLGFETSVPSLHMCFTGSPGTGKVVCSPNSFASSLPQLVIPCTSDDCGCAHGANPTAYGLLSHRSRRRRHP